MRARIRSATSSDFSGVLRLGWSIYSEVRKDKSFGDYVFVRRPSRKNMKDWFNKLLKDARNGDAVYTVAELDGRIVGQCFVRRTIPASEFRHVGTLSVLVDKEHRNAGIGREMLDFALRKCRGRFELIQLFVFDSNARAKSLYRRAGFMSAGTIPRFYKRGRKYIGREIMYLHIQI